ncbi:hypothetical protein KUTeg_002344 [Tegillarca granosa]|uniref:peptidylprolyl isomerase n=1 Tax=Tegillarca granosa TaxID=220873 RepID=A0ABQ9FXM3_TEGGR|nr:hypothetical protein KUTeg_002344 [Tegillarca granosa]
MEPNSILRKLDRPGRPPITFQLGTGQVIPGWEQGLLDMCIGERRKLHIPSHLAYGKTGAGVIPPDTDLIFETEIVTLIDGPPPMNVFRMIDVDRDNYITIEEAALYLSHQAIAQRVPNEIAVQQNKAQLQQLFGTDDKDRDGRVSYEEFSGPKVDPPQHDEL